MQQNTSFFFTASQISLFASENQSSTNRILRRECSEINIRLKIVLRRLQKSNKLDMNVEYSIDYLSDFIKFPWIREKFKKYVESGNLKH